MKLIFTWQAFKINVYFPNKIKVFVSIVCIL